MVHHVLSDSTNLLISSPCHRVPCHRFLEGSESVNQTRAQNEPSPQTADSAHRGIGHKNLHNQPTFMVEFLRAGKFMMRVGRVMASLMGRTRSNGDRPGKEIQCIEWPRVQVSKLILLPGELTVDVAAGIK